jgi:hypothetical protein
MAKLPINFPNPLNQTLLTLEAQNQQLIQAQAIVAQILSTINVETTGPATGDLGGNYPGPTVLKLNGIPLANPLSPTTGQALIYNGSAWTPGTVSASPTGAAGGDLGSTYPNPTVVQIKGTPIATLTSLTLNQVLTWNGSAWVNQNVAEIQGTAIATLSSLSQYQVLAWNGSAWQNETTVVTNIAALRNVPVSAGQVHVQGFSTVNDGGEGNFIWIASPAGYTPDDNIGIVIQSNVGGSTGRWFREGFWSGLNSALTGYSTAAYRINAKWFGAKGDGVTDDTTALQNAMAATYKIAVNANNVYSPLGGSISPTMVSLIIPPGKYTLTDTLDVPSFVWLEGLGLPVLQTSSTTIPIVRTAAAWSRISNIAFVGGLHSIALYGKIGSYLQSGGPYYYNCTAYGNVPCDIDGCHFNDPVGPAIWQDTDPLASVASGSNGQPVSSGTYHVNDTSPWPSSGQFTVITSFNPSAGATINYTGKTSTTFTGCTVVSGTGTLATGMLITGGNYRSFQTCLKVTNFWHTGATLYWGCGDSVHFDVGHSAWDFTNAQTSGDGFPLGLFNSSDNLIVDNMSAFGTGSQAARQAMFVGTSVFYINNSAFAQNDGICLLRTSIAANTYKGAGAVAVPMPTESLGPPALLSVRGTDLTLVYGAMLVEVYDNWPTSIEIDGDANHTDFLGCYGIWVDQASIPYSTLLNLPLYSSYVKIGGSSQWVYGRIFRGWDPGTSLAPTPSLGTEITSLFYKNYETPDDSGTPAFQENLLNIATATGFYSFNAGNTTTDSSTGYGLTLWTGNTGGVGGPGSFTIPNADLMPSGAASGMYCFSFYWRANFEGNFIMTPWTNSSNYYYRKFYNTNGGYQRFEIPFYYDANNASSYALAVSTEAIVPAPITAWAPNTAYSAAIGATNVGQMVTNGGNQYICVHGGTSAASVGPTGTGSNITDGTTGLVWNFVQAGGTWAPQSTAGLWMLNKGTRAAPYVFPKNTDSAIQYNYVPNIYYGTAAPTSGTDTYKAGDIMYNTNPSSNNIFAWNCITGGSPGTWAPVQNNIIVVSNIAALRNAPLTATQVEVQGFSTPGDGGGGTFIWNATNPSGQALDDNVGIVITSNLTSTGRWRRSGFIQIGPISGPGYYNITSDYVNVRWFGAKGDGTTDDTTALQNAINATNKLNANDNILYPSGDGLMNATCYVPNGRYNITSQLMVTGIRLLGDGNSYIQSSATNIALIRTGCYATIIENMKFNGGYNHIAMFGIGTNGPTAFGNVPFFIKGCTFEYPVGPAIWQDLGPFTTIAAGSDGQTLPLSGGTVHVADTTYIVHSNFDNPGGTFVVDISGNQTAFAAITYTGHTSNTFTGCTTATSGTIHTGYQVSTTGNRTFQILLKVVDFHFVGAHFYWGAGDSTVFINGHIAWDQSSYVTSDDGIPLGIFNSGDTVLISNVVGFGNGPNSPRSSMFVGGGNIQFSECNFAQNDFMALIRNKLNGNTFQGLAIGGSASLISGTWQPALTGYSNILVDGCDLVLNYGAFWLEIYDQMPSNIVMNNLAGTEFLGTLGIWIDQGTIALDDLLKPQLSNQLINYNGYDGAPFQISYGWDPGALVSPTLASGTDITSRLLPYHLDQPPVSGTGFRPNLFPYTTDADGKIYLATTASFTTDTTTGYSTRVALAPPTVQYGFFNGTYAADASVFASPYNAPAGIYTYSFYVKANFDGIFLVGIFKQGTSDNGARATRRFYAGDGWQRIWVPFYYPGNNENYVGGCSFYSVPPAITTWTSGATYAATQQVTKGGHVYLCMVGGVAGSTGPTGTSHGIIDGGVTWNYVKEGGTYTPQITTGLIQVNSGSTPSPYTFPGNTAEANYYVPSEYWGTAAPTSGSETYKVGDIFHNINPSSNGYMGWVCTVAGSPGTWLAYGPIDTLSNFHATQLTAGSGIANQLVLAGGTAGNAVTLTASGSDTDVSVIITPQGNDSTHGKLQITGPTNTLNGGSLTLGSIAGNNAVAIWGTPISSITSTNYIFYGNGVSTIVNAATNIGFYIGGTQYGSFGGSYLDFYNAGVRQLGSGNSFSILGNVAATGANAIILDNNTTQTSGKIVSFRSGGNTRAELNYDGSPNFSNYVYISASAGSLTIANGSGVSAGSMGGTIVGSSGACQISFVPSSLTLTGGNPQLAVITLPASLVLSTPHVVTFSPGNAAAASLGGVFYAAFLGAGSWAFYASTATPGFSNGVTYVWNCILIG